VRLVFAGHNPRGVTSLRALLEAGHEIPLVLVHPQDEPDDVEREALAAGLAVEAPVDASDPALAERIAALAPDAVVLAGYGKIVREPLISVARHGCLNLHAGRLPQYRGSSPLNWALINGEREFTLSVTQVDTGIDTGDVLAERTFPIGPADTIADLHAVASEVFPELLLEVLARVEARTLEPRAQDEREAAYFPLRFPDDGLLLWDLVTAEQAHNRIRALTDPYPGAFTFHGRRRLRVLASRPAEPPFHGDPGRVYRTAADRLLVCASDRCLWIERLEDDSGGDAIGGIERYDRLATARWLAVGSLG
jgi:methionyl-tRNA formyltransferase